MSGAAFLALGPAAAWCGLTPRALDEIARSVAKRKEEWLSSELAKRLEPDVFLRAYGDGKCKQDVVKILEEEGFLLKEHPDGRTELTQNDQVLSVLPSLRLPLYS